MRGDSAEIRFQSFVREALVRSSAMDSDVHALTSTFRQFSLPATTSPFLRGALKDEVGEAVVACDMLGI